MPVELQGLVGGQVGTSMPVELQRLVSGWVFYPGSTTTIKRAVTQARWHKSPATCDLYAQMPSFVFHCPPVFAAVHLAGLSMT
jgi:hypothetical protein